jgi:membrane-bound metal-dependent hydrolase YbcI (DUF457 family)
MKILFVLLCIGLILSFFYFISWKENPLRNIALWFFIALLLALFLWIYGYGNVTRWFLTP